MSRLHLSFVFSRFCIHYSLSFLNLSLSTDKIVSEYDQEIRQTQTADGTARKNLTTITGHQEVKLSKATSSHVPIKMIAKLKGT